MSQQLEIEYKTLLTKKEFQQVQAYFQITKTDFFTQTNTYFDTPQNALKKGHYSLRIRQWNTHAEQTLKVPQKIGKLEVTDPLSADEARRLVQQAAVKTSGEVGKYLQKIKIDPTELYSFGTLTTHRYEKHLAAGILALDCSVYYDLTDYELELEVTDAKVGKAAFNRLLQELNIIEKPAKSKIQRMMMGKHAEKFHK